MKAPVQLAIRYSKMKVALLGDIHANLPALQCVLHHAKLCGAEAIYNTGDSIGYGAFPDEVVTILRRNKVVSILGNYDLKIIRHGAVKGVRRPDGTFNPDSAMGWSYRALSENNRSYLKSLPKIIRVSLQGKTILLVHGSPESNTEHLDPQTNQRRLAEIAESAGADIIIAGHAHWPMAKKCARTWFVNTGSVGRPGDGDPRACYAMLVLAGSIKVEHYRIQYNVQRAVAAIQANQLPAEFAAMIQTGRSLEHVMNMNKNESIPRAQQALSSAAVHRGIFRCLNPNVKSNAAQFWNWPETAGSPGRISSKPSF